MSPYAFRIDHDVMVAMRDGVRIATDVYHPMGVDGPAPVLLYRTPYNKDEMAAAWGFARWFAEHGYVVVQQDVRGCHKSEGLSRFLEPEALDGLDTLRWIESQPWGDVDVGSWGTSWSSWAQTAAAVAGPSRLKTMVPMMSGSDAWTTSVRHGGALELRWIAWAFWHAAQNRQAGLGKTPAIEEALIHPKISFRDWLRRWPIRRGETQLALTPAYEAWAFDVMETEDREGFWTGPSYAPASHARALSGISALYIGSWYDSYARGEIELYEAHRDAGGRAQLMMGPWLHGTQTVQVGTAGGVDLGPAAAIADYKVLLLRWFDKELKGQGPGAQPASPVRLFVMGGGAGTRDAAGRLAHGGRWRDEAAWPLPATELHTLYLHCDGALSNAAPAPGAAPLAYDYDPADPVPTMGGGHSSLYDIAAANLSAAQFHAAPSADRTVEISPKGGVDQHPDAGVFQLVPSDRPLAERPDVLVFETEPLTEPLEITGAVRARLWVSTDAADTDFTVKLIDVYPASEALPDGFALNLSDTILRLRYREGDGRSAPVTPGEVYAIELELYPTSNLFVAGHKIRVDISSSNYPRFDRNPNNGASPSRPGELVVARNILWCDAERPSHVVIPVIRVSR